MCSASTTSRRRTAWRYCSSSEPIRSSPTCRSSSGAWRSVGSTCGGPRSRCGCSRSAPGRRCWATAVRGWRCILSAGWAVPRLGPGQQPGTVGRSALRPSGRDRAHHHPAWLLTSAVHSGTPFWIAGAGGVALIVLGGCLLLTNGGRGRSPAVTPLADVGAMALSAYSLQIVAVAVFGSNEDHDGAAGWLELALLSVVTVLLATAWRQRLSRRGPLETLRPRLLDQDRTSRRTGQGAMNEVS